MLYQKDFIEYAQRLVGDKSYDHLIIDGLNSAALDLVSSDTPLILLPGLKTESDVIVGPTTTTTTVASDDVLGTAVAFTSVSSLIFLSWAKFYAAGNTFTNGQLIRNVYTADDSYDGDFYIIGVDESAPGYYYLTRVSGSAEEGDILMFVEGATRAGTTTPLTRGVDLAPVTTTTTNYYDYIAMPSNYLRHLFQVYSADQDSDNIYIYPTKTKLMAQYTETIANGIVTGVAEEGGYLWHRNVPTAADTLTLSYYKKPTEFAVGYNYSVDWLPYVSNHKQLVLIAGMTAATILAEIATDYRLAGDRREAAANRAAAIMAERNAALNDLYLATKDLREKAVYSPARSHTFF